MRRRMLRLHLLGLRMTWLRLAGRLAPGRSAASSVERRRVRTIATLATLATIAGLIAAAAGIQATAASWTDSVNFAAQVSAATSSSSSTTTTTVPVFLASVSVTAVCKNQNTYTLRVDNESTRMLDFTLQAGDTLISGPFSIDGGASQVYDIPNGTSGVAAVPAGAWTNTFAGTASTPQSVCQAPTTTTTTTTTTSTTTTTAPPRPSVTSGGISAANPETVITDIVWNQPDARQVCTDVIVTGSSEGSYDWAIQVELETAPWYGTSPQHVSVRGSGVTTILSPSLVLITGRSNGGPWDPVTNNTPINNTQTAVITICNQTPAVPSPAADASWYAVTTALQPVAKNEACVIVTASPTGQASGPFFFGWTTTVDLTAAKAALVAAGGTPKKISWSPQPNGTPNFSVSPSDFNTPLDEYTITSGYDYALRAGGDSKTITVCVTDR